MEVVLNGQISPIHSMNRRNLTVHMAIEFLH